ncbi:MAG: hypothetical protein C4326_03790 [Ignavibacteria bacterium]
MAMTLRFTFMTALFFAYCLSAFAAGGSVSGRVTTQEEKQGEPIVGASVFLQGTARGTVTNTNGEFRIGDVTAGTYTLVVSMVGYQRVVRHDVVVKEGKDTRVNAAMTPTLIQTDQIVITRQ